MEQQQQQHQQQQQQQQRPSGRPSLLSPRVPPSSAHPASDHTAAQPPPAAPQHAPTSTPDDADEGADDMADLPSDLEAAICFLRTQFMTMPGCADLPPLVLKTQLHTLLSDRTQLDRQLDGLRRANTIRLFKLVTGADEHGILTTNDYHRIIHDAADAAADGALAAARPPALTSASVAAAASGNWRPPSPSTSPCALQGARGTPAAGAAAALEAAALAAAAYRAAASAFVTRVLPHHTDVSISHAQLLQLLRAPPPAAAIPPSTAHAATAPSAPSPHSHPSCSGLTTQRPIQKPAGRTAGGTAGGTAEAQVSLLLNLGAIARHSLQEGSYLLSVPFLGPVIKSIAAGRKELTSHLSRRRYSEQPEAQLLAKLRLRTSRLGVRFHVRDLQGRGALQRLHTTTGNVVRLCKRPSAG